MTDADVIDRATDALREFKAWRDGRNRNSSRSGAQPMAPTDILDAALDELQVPEDERERQWTIWASTVIDAADDRTQKQPPR